MKTSVTIILSVFLLLSSFISESFANGTITHNTLPAQNAKQLLKTCNCPPPCACPREDTCPIGCPCPESWMGGALERCYTPPRAEICEINCCFNSGFYIGGQVGYLNAHHKYNANLGGKTTGNFQQSRKQNTALGGILLGGRNFVDSQFFIGAEVSANMDASSTRFLVTNSVGNTYLHKCKRQYSIVPSAVFGAAFAQMFAAYMKLGADISGYRTILSANEGGITNSFTTHKTGIVFLPAIGVEYCFSPYVSTRIELSYNVCLQKIAMNATTNAGTIDQWRVKAQNTLVSAGFLFKF